MNENTIEYPDIWMRKGMSSVSWEKLEIVGETNRSWIDYYGRKIPKKLKSEGSQLYCFSQEELDDMMWLERNVYFISIMVKQCKDPAKLRAIAKILEK